MQKTICVYLGSNPGKDPVYGEKIRELGRWIGQNGWRLVYGGSRIGLMGMLAQSAMETGAYVIGVEPDFFVTAELQLDGLDELIVTKDMAERKAKLIELSDAFLAFPGGTGTLEEISEIMSGVSLGLVKAPCLLYNVNGFYDPLKEMLDRMTEQGFIPRENREKIRFCPDLGSVAWALEKAFPDGSAV